MSSLDILFWLLIVLMAGIAWAVEAGLAARHRNILAASTVSSLASMLFIMFWIDDPSQLELGPRIPIVKKQGSGQDGGFEYKSEKATPKKQKDGSGGEDEAGEKPEYEDDGNVEYSRVPFKDCRNCPDMVIVPAGTFFYGSPADEASRAKNERERALASVPHPFAVGRLEILRVEFAAFVAETGHKAATGCEIQTKKRGNFNWQSPGFEQDERHPAVCVSWHDANAYVGWLSTRTKRSYRMLSELEWEYIAGGTKDAAAGETAPLRRNEANFARSRDGTIAGGSLTANGFGLSDVIGNAWEMVADCYSEGVAPAAPRPAKEAEACTTRVMKGGGWNSTPALARIPSRAKIADEASINTIGFRVARAVDELDKDKILTAESKAAMIKADKFDAEQQSKARVAAEAAELARIKKEDDARKEAAAKAKARADREAESKK